MALWCGDWKKRFFFINGIYILLVIKINSLETQRLRKLDLFKVGAENETYPDK